LGDVISNETIDRVKAIATPILFSGGMELVEVEYRREAKGWILRLYIDKEGGVTIDDCTHMSQEIERSLDVEDFIWAPYTLEVSSPGLTRPLKSEKDFIKYQNHLIKVKTFDPIGSRRRFKGKLLGVSESAIEIEVEGEIIHIPFTNVAKANLEIDF
jgi:ribosome maturation factor RimP